MRITIVGPGAMGLLFAYFLSKVTKDLWVLDKDDKRSQEIKKNGIRIEGISGQGRQVVNITCDPKEIGNCDLVIICVKSYDTRNAIKSVKSIITDDTLVLTLQNGVGNVEIIAEECTSEKVLGGVTSQGATLIGTGFIKHAGKGDTVIGKIDSKTPAKLRQIRELFNKAGIATRVSKDIKGLIWSKLIINVGINALTAITHLNNGRLVEFETTRRILSQAVIEAVKIAKRKRIKLIYDDPISKVEAVASATGANVSSMLQDILKERHTEIDFINGVIVREGQSLGIPVPVNSILLDLIKTIEASYKMRVVV